MKVIKKIQHHVQKFQFIHQDFDDKALQKNPMDVIGVIFNMRLSLNKDAVAYAKRVKFSSLKELRTLIMKDSASAITALREACKAADTTLLKRAVEEAVSQLTLEYFDLPMEVIIISVLHFLSETAGADFTDRKRTMRTLILEAMLTPEGELPDLYTTARREGKPPRHYQNAMVAVKCNVWHGCGIKIFGPLAPNPVLTWTALKNAVVDLICRQVVPQMTFTKCLEDLKNGRWSQRKNQTVSEFEGEFLHKESILQAACEHDGKEPNRHIPCPDDMQKLFISKISSAVKIEAHVMLTERRADYMMEANLPYTSGRFEDLHPQHFLQLMTITEDIMLKREASKEANLGESSAPHRYQGRDRGPHLPPGNASQWQRKELAKEINRMPQWPTLGTLEICRWWRVTTPTARNSSHRRISAGVLL